MERDNCTCMEAFVSYPVLNVFVNATNLLLILFDSLAWSSFMLAPIRFLNQARAWFIEITLVQTSVCVFVCVCPPRGHE